METLYLLLVFATGAVTAVPTRDLSNANPDTPIATLNYGVERAGYPIFDVTSLSVPAQIEVKYTEHFDGLNHPFGDGPLSFSSQLSNSFRVETFEVATTGRLASPLIQGGQKWQSIRLLTNGTVEISSASFAATIDTAEPEDLPGQFDSYDETLNEIWKLGARAATASCFDKGTQKAIWEVSEENGVFARSTRPSATYKGTHKGGSWFITPANSISLAYGPDFVNQTTLTTFLLDVFEVPFQVKENTWYRITASMAPTGHLAVSIDDTQVFNISRSDYPWALTASAVTYVGSPDFTGTIGFGAYQDHAAYFKNAHVYDTANGSTIYANNLTSPDVLVEYGTQANTDSNGFAFTGPADAGSAIGCEAVQALKGVADVVAALDDTAADELMRSLWGVMLPGAQVGEAQNKSAVGASWEYVNAATRQPGLGLFTSLGHPWGGAPTYVLTEWAAGLRAVEETDGFGYRNWVVAPASGVTLGLTRARARVVTAFDGDLSVEWRKNGDEFGVTIRAPIDTQG
ncbi:hypothetical protein LY78DRAFT_695895 [Colletotrichum sublineola]|nr:hypothetical protein LY78DRAFT_695895 [Colletotrichum sublineola]